MGAPGRHSRLCRRFGAEHGTGRRGLFMSAAKPRMPMTKEPDTRAPEYKEANGRTAETTERAVVPTARARAGVTGHNARYVLGFGLAGIVVAFLAIYLIYFG